MKPIVRMKMEGDTLIIRTRAHIEVRTGDPAAAVALIRAGIERIGAQSPYTLDDRQITVRSELELVDGFSFDAVNVRVEDRPVTRRHGLMRLFNTVSRAYFGAGRRGISKLVRHILRFPDVFINLGGHDLSNDAQRALMQSITAHEFAHVWGCADQYKYRNDQKRSAKVREDDLMYRTGAFQKMQPYHIKRFCACAKKGKLPLRRIV